MAGPQRSRGRAGVQRRPVRSGTEAAPKRSKAGPVDPLPLGLPALSQPRAARRLFSAAARSAEALRGATGRPVGCRECHPFSETRESGRTRGVEKEVSSLSDNWISEWGQLPPWKWTRDSPPLVPTRDNLGTGTSQGGKVEKPRPDRPILWARERGVGRRTQA